jgi:hypothetical protein
MDLNTLPPSQRASWKGSKYSGFIGQNTLGCDIACELGAGIFGNFQLIRSKKKVGIELLPEYFAARTYSRQDCVPILGNALNFEKLLDDAEIGHVDVFLMCDFIEHLDKNDAVDLIGKLKKRGSRIIVFAPGGTCNQEDALQTYGGRVKVQDADAIISAQRHRSTWYKQDFENLGFSVDEILNYHNTAKDPEQFGDDGGSVLYAVWNKNEKR